MSLAAVALLWACGGTAEPVDDGASSGSAGAGAGATVGSSGATGGAGGSGVACGSDTSNPNEVVPGGVDPETGTFTLDEALDGLPEGDGDLRAIITTPYGDITCKLEPAKVPNGVANFVGLARGKRGWYDVSTSEWVRRRYYDGLIFHRIIDDFMAQGGDPLGMGTGGPGYKFADEITDLVHETGTLAYANSGPNTNGSQFYITETKTDFLDGGYTVFGYCSPMSTIEQLTATPTGAGDKPLMDVVMSKVEITRCP
jgi:peptidyl-prolyl cis-trans isomerase A (cyclophilin A)